MLQLFKKSGRIASCHEQAVEEKNASIKILPNDTILSEQDLEEFAESRSRLSMNLVEIISNKSCLCYFIQFLETKKALSFIKFYLEAESFKTATEISFPIKKIQSDTAGDDFDSNSFKEKRRSFSSEGCDSLSYTSISGCDKISFRSEAEMNIRLSTNKMKEEADFGCSSEKMKTEVPELRALCDLSMRKPLTDDEKSQIFAESNKRQLDNISDNSLEKSSSAIATDAIRIYKKYFTLNSPYFLDIPATILSSISLALCADRDNGIDSFSITSSCFEDAQSYVLERIEKEYLNEFLESPFYCKYCVDILTSPDLSLSDILHSESALFYFMEYLEQENQRHCLEFWLASTNFRKHYESNLNSDNREQITKDAMILYEKYFSLQSPYPLKFSDRVRSQVEECICAELHKVIRCFDLSVKIVEKHLEHKYFSNFTSSLLFKHYLTELRSKIRDHKESELHYHRKMLSNSSSDSTKRHRNSFISQQNTLLAMESSRKSKPKKTVAADMKIDSRQLTNPDLLWHRNTTGVLSFGRVNSLGRYERDFEFGCPDEKWSLASGGNRFKNAVRKLVNLPEDKVQEEIAWQVAEMIVKDITSITLGENSS